MSAFDEVKRRMANRWRQMAKQQENVGKELMQWAMEYLPHHFFRSMSKLHKTLAREYDILTLQRGKKVCVIAPRGNAKTTWTVAKVLKAICESTEHYVFLVSDTAKQAETILETIKLELESNERLKNDYPMACAKGPVWNAGRIETANTICVEAFGTGQKVRGKKFRQYRPTLIILDDPDNDEDVRSPTIRTQHIEWFNKALLQCGDTETNVVVVGTMLHRECIVGHIEKRPDFKVIKFQSIMRWPTNMDLWKQWEELYFRGVNLIKTNGVSSASTAEADAFYVDHMEEMNADAEVLWEEKENLITLMKMRANSGHAAFASEKQNDPRDPSKCEFKEEWFDGTEYDFNELQSRLESEDHITVIASDPSKGKDTKKHDYSPILTLHFFGDSFVYVEIRMERIPITMLTDRILDTHVAVKSHAVGIEDQGFQSLIGQELVDKAQERHIYDLNAVAMQNHGVNKLVRISRLSVWLQRKFFKFQRNCPHTALLVQQLKDHPFADHDDGSDVLEMGLRLLNDILTNREDGIGDAINR